MADHDGGDDGAGTEDVEQRRAGGVDRDADALLHGPHLAFETDHVVEQLDRLVLALHRDPVVGMDGLEQLPRPFDRQSPS